jgi:hypothetical protein
MSVQKENVIVLGAIGMQIDVDEVPGSCAGLRAACLAEAAGASLLSLPWSYFAPSAPAARDTLLGDVGGHA